MTHPDPATHHLSSDAGASDHGDEPSNVEFILFVAASIPFACSLFAFRYPYVVIPCAVAAWLWLPRSIITAFAIILAIGVLMHQWWGRQRIRRRTTTVPQPEQVFRPALLPPTAVPHTTTVIEGEVLANEPIHPRTRRGVDSAAVG